MRQEREDMEATGGRYPMRLDPARAWRTYRGGRLLDEFHGYGHGEDGHFPEEWIASLVAARNVGREAEKEEGMSRVSGTGLTLKALIETNPSAFLGTDHVKQLGMTMGVLVKLIDSQERLAVQVHPDREKAWKLFSSEYGKTECWHILGGRCIDGEKPCVYLGFREGVTRARWKELFERQDIPGMLKCLHRFPAEPGDTILIEGGVPHAIGAGCFLVEIQEPTDYTIRVERTTPSGYQAEDAMCHQGLGFETMFECFHYEGLSREETHDRWFLKPRNADGYKGGQAITLAGYEDTPFFCMNQLILAGGETMAVRGDSPVSQRCSGLYVLEGEGVIQTEERCLSARKGDQFFLPAALERLVWKAAKNCSLKMIQCFGPKLI